jgi:hypothetical protein
MLHAAAFQDGGPVLLATRLSWSSPPNQGQAAARSLREPGHVGHDKGRAATRMTGMEQVARLCAGEWMPLSSPQLIAASAWPYWWP